MRIPSGDKGGSRPAIPGDRSGLRLFLCLVAVPVLTVRRDWAQAGVAARSAWLRGLELALLQPLQCHESPRRQNDQRRPTTKAIPP